MSPPDYPRLPVSYTFDLSTATVATLATELPYSTSHNDLVETTFRAAVALAQAAHAGEDRYALALAGGQAVEGDLDREKGEVGLLLEEARQTRLESADEGMRFKVLYESGVDSESAESEQSTPLHLVAKPSSGGNSVTIILSYDTSLLPALEAQWLLTHISTAFTSLLGASPSDLVSSISLAPPSESHTLSAYSTNASFSASSAYPPSGQVLPDFFLHAASLYPNDPAIHFLPDPTSSSPKEGEVILSFAQTLYLARYLAARLRTSLNSSLSSNPPARSAWEKGNLVLPVCVTKSPLLPLSLLAISLTGCGYLALEPSFPEDRKKGICAELSEVGMLAPVAVVESVEGEKERWDGWTAEGKEGARVIPDVVDPEEALGELVQAAAAGATAEELEQRFPYDKMSSGWPLLREDGLAYVIYTSGTTGKPKGIMVEHRQVAAFLRNYHGVFGRAHGERVLQFPSYAFDVSVMNIWDTFAHGSTLCITTPSSLYSSLADSILALKCTLVDLTPTVAAVLFEHAEAVPEEGESEKDAWERTGFRLKQVNTGGEKVEKAVREKWRERGVRVVIDYGPTETTVGVISNQSLAPSPPAPLSLPIGRPTGNTRIAILSSISLTPVPLGCIGEICVLGPQITRGYVLPKLNEGVFVELPRKIDGVGKKGQRVYRTGDLGRWVVAEWEAEGEREGWIECLGRRDGQVKVNGLRIEVGEIEEHLSSRTNPSVLRGIVDKFETSSVSPSLIAYLQLSPSFDPSITSTAPSAPAFVLPRTNSPSFLSLVDSLKARLAEKVPSYMIPRYWVAVSRVPMQGMGKADRKALHALAAEWDWRGAAKAKRNGTAKEGAEEEEKAKTFTRDTVHTAARRAWGAALRLGEDEAAGIADQDEFMKLGGDSIRFMKLVASLRANGYPRLQFKDVVAASTLSDCAAALARSPPPTSSQHDEPFPTDVSSHQQRQPFDLVPSSCRPRLFSELAAFSPSLPESRFSDVYPTSPAQDALLAPSFDSPIGHYYAQAVYSVGASNKELPHDKLQWAVRQMVKKHEALRSVFVVSEEVGTVSVILQEDDPEVEERTCIERIEVGHERELHDAVTNWLERDRQRFAFRWGVLHLSFALFQSPGGSRKLGWGMHHAMSDGWTLELLTADLRSLAFDLDLPLRPPFSSVASWWSKNPDPPSETVDFWRKYLDGARPLAWPSQNPLKGEMLATTGASILHWRGELHALTAKHGITAAIASRVAIIVALGHHASSSDVTIGIVRSGRDIDVPAADEIIGPCVSVLPSRTRFSPSSGSAPTTSGSLLALAHAEASSDRLSRAHQRMTLSQISRTCALSSRSDLFSVLLTYQSLAEHDPSFASAAPWPVQQPPERIHMPTNYALSFEITPEKEDGEKLELACFFDPRVVEQDEVDGVLKSAAKVLDWIVTAPCTGLEEVQAKLGGGGVAGGEKVQERKEREVSANSEVNGVGDEEEILGLVERLTKAWAAVLRVQEDEIAEQDSFNSLGGDSIAAMRLAVWLKKVGLAIPTTTLAKLPTPRKQAEWLVKRSRQ
ncbi:hypothetical protein JCM11251_000821 [Rhodosporidiobolus azoricus]